MNPDKKSIIEKIQKLLALANSSNEHESKAAAEQASRLLTKYNLKMQEVEGHSKDYVTSTTKTTARRSPTHHKLVYDIIVTYFFVQIVRGKYVNLDMFDRCLYYMFVGEEHNVKIAQYVFAFLDRVFPESFKSYRKRTKAPASHKQSYYVGLWHGIKENLKNTRQQVQQETGLVVVHDSGIDEFLKKLFEDGLKQSKAQNADIQSKAALEAGLEDGKKVSIAMGLGGREEDRKQVGTAPLALGGK